MQNTAEIDGMSLVFEKTTEKSFRFILWEPQMSVVSQLSNKKLGGVCHEIHESYITIW